VSPRRAPGLLLATLLTLLLVGCSGADAPEADETPDDGASPSATAEPLLAPEVGECHALSLEQATAPSAEDTGVRCRGRHTSVTVAVRPLDLLDDGHLLDVDSAAAADRFTRTCSPRLARWAGGDEETRRLSRLQVVWFAPTREQVEAGADWVRCDLVAVASEQRLLPLPARSRGMLDRPRVAERFATCGTASPDAGGFERVSCGQPHRWRAVGTHDFAAGSRYLGDAATAALESRCEDVASARSPGALELTWASEWPTRAQWDAGQRWGWCWVPENRS
jgi:hypothetical protein